MAGESPEARRGVLFVVATPIGNLGDMTLRAIDTLRACDRILAEDTRRTRQLLAHFGVTGKPLDRFDAHADEGDRARVLARLAEGERVAMVTDAGTPSVSDPGERLVRAAIAAGVSVVPIPGASAVLAALVASGVAGESGFRFVGFLPRSGRARGEAIVRVCETPESVVVFEAPGRVARTLRDLAARAPERRACVARELTKLHEELVRGTLAELSAVAGDPDDEKRWAGEVVLVIGERSPRAHPIAGADTAPESHESGAGATRADETDEADHEAEAVFDAAVDERIVAALAEGRHVRQIAEDIAAWSGLPRRELYARIVRRKKG